MRSIKLRSLADYHIFLTSFLYCALSKTERKSSYELALRGTKPLPIETCLFERFSRAGNSVLSRFEDSEFVEKTVHVF